MSYKSHRLDSSYNYVRQPADVATILAEATPLNRVLLSN